jgi:hypothetical protein
MDTRNKKKATLVIMNIIAVLAISAILFLIYKQRTLFVQYSKESAEETAKIDSMESLGKLVKDTVESRDFLNKVFVDKEKITDFLEMIEALGPLSGSKVSIVSVDDGGKKSNSGNFIKIRFKAEGNWTAVYKLISLVDHIPSALSVTAVQFSKDFSDERSKISTWSATIEANIFKLPS